MLRKLIKNTALAITLVYCSVSQAVENNIISNEETKLNNLVFSNLLKSEIYGEEEKAFNNQIKDSLLTMGVFQDKGIEIHENAIYKFQLNPKGDFKYGLFLANDKMKMFLSHKERYEPYIYFKPYTKTIKDIDNQVYFKKIKTTTGFCLIYNKIDNAEIRICNTTNTSEIKGFLDHFLLYQ